MQRSRIVLLVALVAVLAACTTDTPADLVLVGGRIITLDDDRPEAEALAVRGQRIVAVGSEGEVRRFIGEATRVVDLGGAVAYPGFVEGHAHFLSLGRARLQLELGRARSWPELVEMVAAAAEKAAPGQWILGRGWHQEKWSPGPGRTVDAMPVHDDLSAVSPDNPVLLTHASGHAVLVNARALALAGIDGSTPDPAGGEILRDGDGRPTGVLLEEAEALVDGVLGDEAVPRRRLVEEAAAECLQHGITSFHDAGASAADVALFRELAEAGKLQVRLWVMLSESNEVLAERASELRTIGAGDGFLTVRAVKRLADGALGSHGAWLLEPYDDLPGSMGLNTYPMEDLRRTAEIALEHDLQLAVHAIGDRANREVLDVYEAAFAGRPGGGKDLRWRIEHAQHLDPTDVGRFAGLGVIASMQPTHCTSDGPWVEGKLGAERAASGAYLWRDLLDSGAVVVAGTDAPVEAVDPLATFAAAVTRRMADGARFFPEQAMTRMEALHAMTTDAAYAAFEERDRGVLTPGRLADVTVLSQDILTVGEERLEEVRVLYTVVGGRVHSFSDG